MGEYKKARTDQMGGALPRGGQWLPPSHYGQDWRLPVPSLRFHTYHADRRLLHRTEKTRPALILVDYQYLFTALVVASTLKYWVLSKG